MYFALPWPKFSVEDRIKEVNNFFKSLASNYDIFEEKSYWTFSNKLLWEILLRKVFKKAIDKTNVSILDAGIGTARWVIDILRYLPSSTATGFDISNEMISIAKKNLKSENMLDRVEIFLDDVEKFANLQGRFFDVVTCFHNVIGFNSNPEIAFLNLCSSVAPNGTLLLVLPNFYHALSYVVQNDRFSEIKRINAHYSVKYTDANPEILLFTPAIIKQLLNANGFKHIEILGFPIATIPQFRGNEILQIDDTAWHDLLRFESDLCCAEEAAIRGKNLLVIAKH